MHLVWKSDFENEKVYTRATIQNAKALVGLRITACCPLVGKLPRLQLDVTSDYPPADYFEAGSLMFVSERLKAMLTGHFVDAEFLPIELIRDERQLDFGTYYCFNLLGKVDCFDYQNSVYQSDGEFVDKIDKLVIDEAKGAGYAVCRLDRCFDIITLIEQELADAILRAGFTGAEFIAPADWRW